jgi:hypothetical protein
VIVILSTLSAVPRLGKVMPGQLNTWAGNLATGNPEPAWTALAGSIGLIVAALVVAWQVLERQEL